MTLTIDAPVTSAPHPPADFLWLELTGRCNLECVHCYADAGPAVGHGAMTAADWLGVIDQAADSGTRRLSLIGGEPTTHPQFPDLLCHALSRGQSVEVFSNLYHVTRRTWELLQLPGVSLATSYYSDSPTEHDAVTLRRGSHARTRANISMAVHLGIPIRVGLISLTDDQRSEQARADLVSLGVRPDAIGFDRVRAFGRGAQGTPDEAQSCGACGHGKAAILPDGTVTPCVFTRTATTGNVRDTPLADVLTARSFADQVARLDAIRPTPGDPSICAPDEPLCTPHFKCGPNSEYAEAPNAPLSNHAEAAILTAVACAPSTGPCGPDRNCGPVRCPPNV